MFTCQWQRLVLVADMLKISTERILKMYNSCAIVPILTESLGKNCRYYTEIMMHYFSTLNDE